MSKVPCKSFVYCQKVEYKKKIEQKFRMLNKRLTVYLILIAICLNKIFCADVNDDENEDDIVESDDEYNYIEEREAFEEAEGRGALLDRLKRRRRPSKAKKIHKKYLNSCILDLQIIDIEFDLLLV